MGLLDQRSHVLLHFKTFSNYFHNIIFSPHFKISALGNNGKGQSGGVREALLSKPPKHPKKPGRAWREAASGASQQEGRQTCRTREEGKSYPSLPQWRKLVTTCLPSETPRSDPLGGPRHSGAEGAPRPEMHYFLLDFGPTASQT